MKFTVPSAELLSRLSTISGAIITNPVLPILLDFHFRIEGNTLYLTATDLETSITTSMDIKSDKDGSVAIPARILMDTLKQLPEQPVTISADEGNFNIEITSNYGSYKLAGENGDEFPKIPSAEGVEKTNIPADKLSNAIGRTLFATSNDELRPAMSGVFFQVEFKKIVFVATDAHKLVKYALTNIASETESSFIIPTKALNLLKGILPSEGDVQLSYNRNYAFFNFDDVSLACRLIDAKFPDYNAVIPTENPNVMTVSKRDFQNSLKRIAIYANKTTNQVVFNIGKNNLTISAQDLDFSNEAKEEMACDYNGDAMGIGFNAKFLIEMLGVLQSDDVELRMSKPTTASILMPKEKPEDEDVLMLLMPVMLST